MPRGAFPRLYCLKLGNEEATYKLQTYLTMFAGGIETLAKITGEGSGFFESFSGKIRAPPIAAYQVHEFGQTLLFKYQAGCMF